MWVYIIKSIKIHRYYIGHTSDLSKRIEWHNLGFTKSTKFGIPWNIIYKEKCNSRSEAVRREKEIKSYKSGNAFRKLIGGVA